MKFYVNKFKLINVLIKNDESELQDLPEGTVFVIDGIEYGLLLLKPISGEEVTNMNMALDLFKFAFTETDNALLGETT